MKWGAPYLRRSSNVRGRRKGATRELRGIVSSPPRGTPHKSGQRTERAVGRLSIPKHDVDRISTYAPASATAASP